VTLCFLVLPILVSKNKKFMSINQIGSLDILKVEFTATAVLGLSII
jgi:hypothetical protein